jgi:hypothetical protein
MAKKTLLSENQISKFMKLANIKEDRINNFIGSGKKKLNEEYTGMGGTGGMEEDEPAADEDGMDSMDDMGDMGDVEDSELPAETDMEPEAPEGQIEASEDEFESFLTKALEKILPAALEKAMGGAGMGGMGEMEGEEPEMEDLGDMSAEEETEDVGGEEEAPVEEEEPNKLDETKYGKVNKKARNTGGGDAKMKESLTFKDVDLVTDDQIVNEVLKRVIRRLM